VAEVRVGVDPAPDTKFDGPIVERLDERFDRSVGQNPINVLDGVHE